MSRFVTAVPYTLESKVAGEAADAGKPAKEYFERIGKYVPSEIIAGYTGLNALLVTFPQQIQYGSYIACFLLCMVLTPIYFKIIATQEDKPSLKYQIIVSTIAFVVWAYAIDGGNGIFGKMALDIYYQSVGGALLIIFSLISGAFIPKK